MSAPSLNPLIPQIIRKTCIQMNGQTRFLLMFLLSLLVGCGKAEQRTLTFHDQIREDLQQYHDGVLEAWAYVDSKKNEQSVDLTAARDRLLARVEDSATPEHFALLLQEFAASLQDGHSSASTSSLGEPFPNSWPIGVLLVKEGIIVANLNWLTKNPGIQLGDRLIRVNEQPVESYLQSRMAVTTASTELARKVLAVDSLHRTSEKQVRLTLEHLDGSQYEADLPCLPHHIDYRQQTRSRFCTHKQLDDQIGVIRIPQFTWNEKAFLESKDDLDAPLREAKDQIDEAFAAVQKCSAIILDLRNNAGGYELLSTYVAEHLVPGDFTYDSTERRDSKLIRSLEQFQKLEDSYFGRPIPQHPRAWKGFRHFDGTPFEGELIVLINPRCFSTTDNLCAFLKDVRPRTRFVGRPTQGGTGEPTTVFTLRHSGVPVQFCISRIYSPEGRLIEGTGTQPDIEVQPAREDLLANRDPDMEVAVKLLKN